MITYRTAKRNELDLMLDWAAAEGWNPGIDDAEAFWQADPQGFFVALDGQMPVASISVVNHSNSFAFLGLYIVLESHRGRGIGLNLWRHALTHTNAHTVGLDGVAEQQANYASSGFVQAGGTTRFAGRVAPLEFESIRFCEAGDVRKLIEREAEVTHQNKPAYLAAWFSNTEHRKTILSGEGFCTIRRCRNGAKIGPLIANDKLTAHRLIQHAATIFGSDITIDVPDTSCDLTELCQTLNFTAGFQTARMYLGDAPSQASKLFAVTSLELG